MLPARPSMELPRCCHVDSAPFAAAFFSGKEDSSTLLGIGMSAASPSSFPRPLQSWKPTSASLQVPPSPEDVGRPHGLEVCAEDTVIR